MKDINVSDKSWHYKLYQKAVDIWFAFMDRRFTTYDWNTGKDIEHNTMWKKVSNLCFYMRVLIVWMPLVFIFQVVTWLMLFGSTIILPIYLFGVGSRNWYCDWYYTWSGRYISFI